MFIYETNDVSKTSVLKFPNNIQHFHRIHHLLILAPEWVGMVTSIYHTTIHCALNLCPGPRSNVYLLHKVNTKLYQKQNKKQKTGNISRENYK